MAIGIRQLIKTIRIKDIARLAGVSPGTVDRVLHNRGRVSDEALKKVMTVLDQIDYKPNLLARTLASNKVLRLAVLVPNPDQDPYWAQSWSGIVQAQQDWSYYNITVESFHFDIYEKKSFAAAATHALAAHPQGILIAPIFYHEAIPFFEQFRSAGIPYVFFNTNIPEVHPMSFIGQDLYQSGRVGAELMQAGFGDRDSSRFVMLHIGEDVHNSVHLAEKEKGFRDYLREKHHNKVQVDTQNLDHQEGAAFENQIVAIASNADVRGIFVSTSKATFIVASILARHPKREIGLGGYDLMEESVPYLKSGTIDFLINQNPKRQARVGISHLVNHLMFKKDPPLHDLFPLEIITQENYQSYLGSGIH